MLVGGLAMAFGRCTPMVRVVMERGREDEVIEWGLAGAGGKRGRGLG